MIGNLQGFLIWMFGSIPLQKRAERQVPPWVGRNFKLTYPRMRGDDISAWQDQAGGVVVNGWYEEQDVERCKQIQEDAKENEQDIVDDAYSERRNFKKNLEDERSTFYQIAGGPPPQGDYTILTHE